MTVAKGVFVGGLPWNIIGMDAGRSQRECGEQAGYREIPSSHHD